MSSSVDSTRASRPFKRRSARKWVWRASIALALVAIVGVSVNLMSSETATSGTSSTAPILTHTVKRGDLDVTVIEQGVLESSENTEIKCKVRGDNTVVWVIENGTYVQPGDELVRLDTLEIEDSINERSKFAHWSRSGADWSEADVARSKLAIKEYEDGRFVSQLMQLEKNLAVAEARLSDANNRVDFERKRAQRGFIGKRDLERTEFTAKQAQLNLEASKKEIEVLKTYTKAIEMETLKGNLNTALATHAANVERAELDEKRRDQAKAEFNDCTIKAEKAGLVIYPSSAAWKETPDIAEGATVHKNQVLLLMPDMTQMQVKVGVHESMVDRIKKGMKANVNLPDESFAGSVELVAPVARPSGWWTGGIVKYDTIVKLPKRGGLKPGMSSEVEIIVAQHKDVLLVPVSTILETDTDSLCWVSTPSGPERREIKLGDTNDVYIVVEEGLQEGEEVILSPLSSVKEAQDEALLAINESSEEDTEEEKEAESGKPE